MTHLVALLVASLGAVGITLVVRIVPPFSRWNEQGVKPVACDLCMSLWMTALCLVIGAAAERVTALEAFFLWMPAFACAYGIVQRIVPPPLGGPPIDPPSPDSENP